MPIRHLPHTRFARANRKRGVSLSIPDASEALFVLNSISGDNMIDAVNGWEFPITGKDWESDEWNAPLMSLPWKTSATISAPADGSAAATAIQAIDSANFWYAVGGVANVIPIQAFFQNINFADLYFCRHIERTANGTTGVEEYPPSVTDITLYNTARAIDSTYTDYFGTEIVPDVGAKYVDIVNGLDTNDGSFAAPFKTITYAKATATTGTIYIFSGTYTEAVSYTRVWKMVGINFPKLTGSDGAASNPILQTGQTGKEFNHIHADGESTKHFGFVLSHTDQIVDKCLIENCTTYNVSTTLGKDSGTLYNSALLGSGVRAWCWYLDIQGVLITLGNNVPDVAYIDGSGTIDITYKYNKYKALSTVTGTPTTFSLSSNFTGSHSRFDLTYGVGKFLFYTFAATPDIDIDLQYCKFTSTNRNAELITNRVDAAGMASLVFKNCTVEQSGSAGLPTRFHIDVRDVPVVTIEDNYFDNEAAAGGIVGVLANVASPMVVSIKNNVTRHRNTDFYHYRLGQENTSAGDDQMDITFENNSMYGAGYFGDYSGANHGVLIGYQANPTVIFNRVIGNPIGIVLKHEGGDYATSEVHSNILIECGIGILPKGVDDCNVYENTFKNEVNNGLAIKTEQANLGGELVNLSIRNNIMVNTHASGTYAISINDGGEVGLDVDYNSYYSLFAFVALEQATPRTWAAWQGLGYEANGTQLSEAQQLALFTDYDNDDFSLPVGSQALGNGETLASPYDVVLDALTNWGSGSTLPVIVTQALNVPADIGAYGG